MADTLFSCATVLAMAGWAFLLLSPLIPRLSQLVAGSIVPLVLAVAYASIVLAWWSSGQGGFDTLDSVANLFQSRWLLLAGWIHYLAFDLFVGAWIARTARREAIPHVLVVPCLALTFLFGPAGLLAFQSLRLARTPLAVAAA